MYLCFICEWQVDQFFLFVQCYQVLKAKLWRPLFAGHGQVLSASVWIIFTASCHFYFIAFLQLKYWCTSWNQLELCATSTFSKPWANCIFTMPFLLKTNHQIMNQWPLKKLKNIHPSDNFFGWIPAKNFWEIKFCKTFVIFQTLRRWDTQTWQSFKWQIE